MIHFDALVESSVKEKVDYSCFIHSRSLYYSSHDDVEVQSLHSIDFEWRAKCDYFVSCLAFESACLLLLKPLAPVVC